MTQEKRGRRRCCPDCLAEGERTILVWEPADAGYYAGYVCANECGYVEVEEKGRRQTAPLFYALRGRKGVRA